MLDHLINISLRYRLMVITLAGILLVLGTIELGKRPVDIFPDLNQPIVTVLAEAHGYAPEEVETLITLPIEAALSGAPGVERIRSTSKEGLALVRAEFAWDTDLYLDRQLVQERLQLAAKDLPLDVVPELAPISSITGEILNIGLISKDPVIDAMQLRTLADWVVRRQLLSVKGVSQVVIIGGEKKQYQVLADPDMLFHHQIQISKLAEALGQASKNTSGGYIVEGSREMLVRNLGRLRNTHDIEDLVVSSGGNRVVRVRDVAKVSIAPEFSRGTAAIDGKRGVLLVVFKQPEADTIKLTMAIDQELEQLRRTMPKGVTIRGDLFRQATFLKRGVDNVIDALRDGSILVVLVIFMFLLNLRASVITLVSLPLSFAATGIVFSMFDLSLNTMTLGGLAIAVGELVDDAIVGVENIVRRMRLDKLPTASPECFEDLVAGASSEVRGPIFSGTLIVVLVFMPLFALSGIEGRLFSPLAVAYVIAILASMVVSLTVTPVLALLFFRKRALRKLDQPSNIQLSFVLNKLHAFSRRLITFSINHAKLVLVGSFMLFVAGVFGATTLGSQFLPDFDEGTILVMTKLNPGTSLSESDRLTHQAEERLANIPGVLSISRYTGRGEHDEHAASVGISHLMLTIDDQSDYSRNEILEVVRERLKDLKGLNVSVGQPLAHRIDHLLSGVQAQIAIKVAGTDLDVLRGAVEKIAQAAKTVTGVADLFIEQQVLVSQVHVELNRERLAEVGLSPGELAEELEVAIGGEEVGTILEGEWAFDLFVRLKEQPRSSIYRLRQLPIRLPDGGWTRLGELARVHENVGPNQIVRDNLLRRIAISCNTSQRSVGDVVADLREIIEPIEESLPSGTRVRLEGQFASQEQATQMIVLLSILSLGAMLLILFAQFKSLNLSLQVLACIPIGFLGGVVFLIITGQHFSIAALVGFVSLAGIATRNGILLVTHYLYLMGTQQKPASPELLIQAGQERAAPVVMTALTTGVGLLPLLLSAGETGREILYPVASVVVGGLLTSTFFEFILRPALFWIAGRNAAAKVALTEDSCIMG
jgi:HME family heavy-metal exporter